MRTHTKRWVWMGAVVVLGALVAASCGKDAAGPITGNRPPETRVFLPQNPDTSLYIQTLSWWGEDIDGEVTHYLFRFLCNSGPSYSGDTAWVTTTVTELANRKSGYKPCPGLYQSGERRDGTLR